MEPTATEHSNRILPERFQRPVWLLWLWLLPQALLLVLNGRAAWLAVGEMTTTQKLAAGWVGGYEFGLLLLGAGLLVGLGLQKRPVHYLLCVAGLLLHIGYLWLFMARFSDFWPAAVAPWMLPESELVYYQFACIMPALFYCGVRLACFDAPVQRRSDTAFSLAAFVVIPAAWYLLFQLGRLLFGRWASFRLPETLAVVFFTVSTVLVLMAFFRLLLLLYGWLQAKPWSHVVLPLVAGLVAPLGGLWLNHYIPFPCDLQSPGLYTLTVINGLVLLLPSPRSPTRRALLWLVRCSLYAFSLYFFVVFLPFLPLSLLAMLACGAGFLILAPTLLFVIHTRQILSDSAEMIVRWGRALTTAAFVGALLLMPLVFTWRAIDDKIALQQAMALAYSPDLQTGKADLNRTATKRALEHLREMKEGLFLPFLSDYYNRLVFNGLVLPDDKTQLLYRLYFGHEEPKPDTRRQWSLFLAPNSRARGRSNAGRTEPPRQVQLAGLDVQEVRTNDLIRASLTLSMTNSGPGNSEYVADLVIPDGVLVSGYWLEVAGQRKTGKMVEKKTAQWVYHMIRDVTRRDPGLLAFKEEDRLALRVYPFAVNETRKTGIDLCFPSGLHPRIRVGEREVTLGLASEESARPLVANLPDGRVQLLLSGAAAKGLPLVARTPYLHFIIDRSAAATNALPDLVTVAAQIAGAPSLCRISLANYEHTDLTPGLIPLAAARGALAAADAALPRRGGFCSDRAMAHALLRLSSEEPISDPDGTLAVPLFVVITGQGAVPVSTVHLAPFRRIVPDLPYYYLWSDLGLHRIAFTGEVSPSPGGIDSPTPVVLLQSERRFAACPAGVDTATVSLPGTAESLRCFDPAMKGFVPLTALQPLQDPGYLRGLALWEAYRATVWAPDTLDDRLRALVTDSRGSGILTPLTAYMVVENTAQEKMLTRKEKQALGADHALEFEESQPPAPAQNMPEPGTVWLLPVTLALLFWHARRKGSLSKADAAP